jgi:hypothetical protein
VRDVAAAAEVVQDAWLAALLRRLDPWRDGGVAARFAEACVAHGVGLVPSGNPARAYLNDATEAAQYGYVALEA